MACVWKLHPAVVVFVFYSVSSAFCYWHLLEVRWHIMKLCTELWGLYFPPLSQNEKMSLHWDEVSCMVRCWTVDVESVTPENRTTSCNSCTCNTKGSTKPRNPTDLKHLTHKQSPGALLTAGCFFRQPPRYCKFHWGGRNDGSNRLIRASLLKINPRSLRRCLKTGCGVSCEHHQKWLFLWVAPRI